MGDPKPSVNGIKDGQKPTEKLPSDKPVDSKDAEKVEDPLFKAAKKFTELKETLKTPEDLKVFLESYGKDGSPLQEKKKTSDAEKAKELQKNLNIDNKLTDYSAKALGIPKPPPGFGAKYLDESWNVKSITTVDNAVTLNASQWVVLLAITKALHAYRVSPSHSMTKARNAAFALRMTTPAVQKTEVKSNDTPTPILPQFEVYDDSTITIKETSSALSSAMAQNGFASEAVEASLSGGAFGVSVAASGGFNKESQNSTAIGSFHELKQYVACYNFPRARMFLDELDLDLDAACSDAVKDLIDTINRLPEKSENDTAINDALTKREKFLYRYGHLFATTFLLGGQLIASKSASSFASTSEVVQRDAMKYSAAISFDSKFVSGSASYSHETSTTTNASTSAVENATQLAWSARGGNTLLVANPPEWANSIANFSTWRAIEQSEVVSVPDLISRVAAESEDSAKRNLKEFSAVLNKLDILDSKFRSQQPKVKWSGKFQLVAADDLRCVVMGKDGNIGLSEAANARDALTFTAISADVTDLKSKTNTTMTDKLLEEFPMFLPTSRDPGNFQINSDSCVPGLWVKDGRIQREVSLSNGVEVRLGDDVVTPCRWSLRLERPVSGEHASKWTPQSKVEIRDGATVTLHCHSYLGGVYKDVKDPPFWAPAVYRGGDKLAVMKVSLTELISAVALATHGVSVLAQDNQDIRDLISKDENAINKAVHNLDRGNALTTDTNILKTFSTISGYKADGPESAVKLYKNSNSTLGAIMPDQQFVQLMDTGWQDVENSWKKSAACDRVATFKVKYVS